MKHSRTIAAAVAALMMFTAVGCSSDAEKSDPATSTVDGTSDGADSSGTTKDANGNDTVRYGETATIDDGLKVTVSEPAAFTPEAIGAGDTSIGYINVDVTVTNDTDDTFDGMVMVDALSAGKPGVTSSLDPSESFTNEVTLATGNDITLNFAFGIDDPEDVAITVTPGFESEGVTFSG